MFKLFQTYITFYFIWRGLIKDIETQKKKMLLILIEVLTSILPKLRIKYWLSAAKCL